MKIEIINGSHGIGNQLLKSALVDSHEVTVLLRKSGNLDITDGQV